MRKRSKKIETSPEYHYNCKPQHLGKAIQEHEAMKLKSVNGLISVAVVMIISRVVRVNDVDNIEFLFVNEFQDFGGGQRKVKFPTAMLRGSESFIDAINRRLPEEVGIKPTSIRFCFASEFTSTGVDKHFKVFVSIENFEGKIISGGSGDISERNWVNGKEINDKVILESQKEGIKTCMGEFWRYGCRL